MAVSEIWTDDCFVVGLSFVQEHAVYLAGVALSISSLMVGNAEMGINKLDIGYKVFVRDTYGLISDISF